MIHKSLLFVLLCSLAVFIPAASIHFPDASRIVFNSDFSGNHEIYLLSSNTLTQLTKNTWSDVWPVPDRQGRRIVFSANPFGNFDLFIMDLQTRAVTRLTSDPRDELAPSWSADGRSIYYDILTGKKNYQSLQLELASRKVFPLFPDSPYRGAIVPFANTRGDTIFFTAKVLFGWLVAKYEIPQKRFTSLTGTNCCRPKAAPDDSRVAYVCGDDDGNGDIFLMNADGSAKTNLTVNRPQFYDYYPCFSPDGTTVVFASSPKELGKTAYQLYTINVKTLKTTRIFACSGNCQYPSWFR
jgi:Tol biopolymer transport system component